jgi:two-component system chemotaxis sensor kinase CheA
VRDTVERVGGTVAVRSTRGQGTVFTIVVAASLATYRAVEVVAGGRSFLLPTARVERCVRAGPKQLRTVGPRQVIAVGEHDLPLVGLAALLQLPASASTGGPLPCVVLETGGGRVALAVDAIRGEQEVLGRPTDTAVTGSAVVAGTAVLGAGQAATLLNASELVRMALRAESSGAAVPLQPARGRAVLLAEDSITSRTLLKNILELAGHRVEVAADGAEALQKLRAGRYDVVVSDIEMPRLDGIALTQAIRAEPELAQVPVVLVSSLATDADRERGTDAGANAYIVKSSFDPATLLQTVAELA